MFLEDPSARLGPGVPRLGNGEVGEVQVGAWESAGMCLYKVWRDDGTMSGPYPGVLLGSLQYMPVPSDAEMAARMSDDEVRELLADAGRTSTER